MAFGLPPSPSPQQPPRTHRPCIVEQFVFEISELQPLFRSLPISFCTDSLMGSASEDEDDDDPPHLRGPALGLGVLGPNGPDSAGGPLGTSDISVQSMSTDSKNTHDDSDQVSFSVCGGSSPASPPPPPPPPPTSCPAWTRLASLTGFRLPVYKVMNGIEWTWPWNGKASAPSATL